MEQKGDLLIHDVWQNGTNSVHDMRVVKTDAKSYLEKTPVNFLQDAARAKKNMFLFFALRCLCWWVTGCGGGRYPEKDIHPPRNKVAATLLEDVRIRKYQDFHHFGVNHKLVHQGSRLLEHRISVKSPHWEDGASINLFLQACQGNPHPSKTCTPFQPGSPHIEVGTDGLSQLNLQTVSPSMQPDKRNRLDRSQDEPLMAGIEDQGSPAFPRQYIK